MALGGGFILIGLGLVVGAILLTQSDIGDEDVDIGPYHGPAWLTVLLFGIVFFVVGGSINFIEGVNPFA